MQTLAPAEAFVQKCGSPGCPAQWIWMFIAKQGVSFLECELSFSGGKGNLPCNLFPIIYVFDLVELWTIRMFFISFSGPSGTHAIQISHFTGFGGLREVKRVLQAQLVRVRFQGFSASAEYMTCSFCSEHPFSSPVSSYS